MNQEQRETLDAQTEASLKQQGEQIGMQTQQSEVAERKFNPGFYQEIADPDTDTDVWDWIRSEIGPVLAKPHILGDRDRSYVEESQLLDMNKAERIISENDAGRLLKKNPGLHAFWQGCDGPDDEDFTELTRHAERRVIRDALELATSRKSLSVGGRGLDALTKATTETQVRKNRESEKNSVKDRLTSVVK